VAPPQPTGSGKTAIDATGEGLTALVGGDRKCADNNGWTVQKRSHEAAQAIGAKKRRRLRNGQDGGGRHDLLAYIGIKTGSFPSFPLDKGPGRIGRAPLPFTP
jgi:hypothetical protein